MMKIVLIGWIFLLAGCATIPPALNGHHFAEVMPNDAQHSVGSRVRWGGTIAKVSTERGQTCFEMVSRPLDASARPVEDDRTEGRFIACAPGFYDPAVYAAGREVTFVGELQAPSLGKVGEYEYLFPHLAASSVYLWPKQPAFAPYYYDPFWYQPGPWMMGPW
jgi:outer membrane lipoprotein